MHELNTSSSAPHFPRRAHSGLAAALLSVTLLAACQQQQVPQASAPSLTAQETDAVQAISDRGEIVRRGKAWVTEGVPYSMALPYHASGYRRDCSGFVSMAWGLATPGSTTSTLPNSATMFTDARNLKPGDAINNPALGGEGHVVLFVGWATTTEVNKTNNWRIVVYEENGGAGKAVERTLTLTRQSTGRFTLRSDAYPYPGQYDLLRSKAVRDVTLPIFTHQGDGDLMPGEGLMAGDRVYSANRTYQLVMQADGNLVLYNRTGVEWVVPSNTWGKSIHGLIMQGDGNLVIYAPTGQAHWSTGTAGNPGAWLAIQDDGNVVMRQGSRVLWSRRPVTTTPPPTSGHDNNELLTSGETMTPTDDCIHSRDGRFHLCFQRDRNLALYGPTGVLWATGNLGGDKLIMQADGNLVMYSGSTPVWHTGTGGHPGASLAVQDDGNLVIYFNGTPIWNR